MSTARSRAYARRMVGRAKVRQGKVDALREAVRDLKSQVEYLGYRDVEHSKRLNEHDVAFRAMIDRKRADMVRRLMRMGVL